MDKKNMLLLRMYLCDIIYRTDSLTNISSIQKMQRESLPNLYFCLADCAVFCRIDSYCCSGQLAQPGK